jgi:hypothetical protein
VGTKTVINHPDKNNLPKKKEKKEQCINLILFSTCNSVSTIIGLNVLNLPLLFILKNVLFLMLLRLMFECGALKKKHGRCLVVGEISFGFMFYEFVNRMSASSVKSTI